MVDDESENRIDFFEGLLKTFKEQQKVDIWLQPGDQTDAIPAHKLILVARSKVFSNILDSDDSWNKTITVPEMTHDELETFLEFMYNGSLPDTKLVHHVHTLYVAADKYEIPYLQEVCRNQLIASMKSSDVFYVFELAETHSDKILKDAVAEFISTNMEDISFSSEFISFVENNPALTVKTI
ncbi:BTB/POZ domain, partial [Arabidopsis suecica]